MQRISEEEKKEYEAAFKMFDGWGGDHKATGVISPTELQAVLRGIGGNPSLTEVEHLIKDDDLDGDGALSLSEFISFMVRMQSGTDTVDKVVNAFKVIGDDRDETFKINEKGLSNILQTVGEKFQTEEVDRFMQNARQDIDEDGNLHYKNYVERVMGK